MGGPTRGVGGTTYPHFCGMYPAGGTTQFTLYTFGLLQVQATAGRKSYAIHSRLGKSNSWISCTVCYNNVTESLTRSTPQSLSLGYKTQHHSSYGRLLAFSVTCKSSQVKSSSTGYLWNTGLSSNLPNSPTIIILYSNWPNRLHSGLITWILIDIDNFSTMTSLCRHLSPILIAQQHRKL